MKVICKLQAQLLLLLVVPCYISVFIFTGIAWLYSVFHLLVLNSLFSSRRCSPSVWQAVEPGPEAAAWLWPAGAVWPAGRPEGCPTRPPGGLDTPPGGGQWSGPVHQPGTGETGHRDQVRRALGCRYIIPFLVCFVFCRAVDPDPHRSGPRGGKFWGKNFEKMQGN